MDIIITNMQPRYAVPVIRPPIRPDSSTQGKPSDHSVAVAVPVQRGDRGVTREYRTRTFRPTPESSREMFGNLLLTVSWDYVYLAKTSIDKVTKLDEMTKEMVEICFPEVTVKYNNQYLLYITAQLKKMARLKKKEYKKNGRSEKYKRMNFEYKKNLKEESARYLEKNVNLIKCTNPAKAARVLRTLGAEPGDVQEKGFTLSNHQEAGLSVEEQRQEIL